MRCHRRRGPDGDQQGSELVALRIERCGGLSDALRLSAVALSKAASDNGTSGVLRHTLTAIWPIGRIAVFRWTAGPILRRAWNFPTRRSELRTPERHSDEHHRYEQTRRELRRSHVVIVPQHAVLRDVRPVEACGNLDDAGHSRAQAGRACGLCAKLWKRASGRMKPLRSMPAPISDMLAMNGSSQLPK